MTDAELNHYIDILRESTARAFNHYSRSEAKRLSTVFHALLRERAARLDQCGQGGIPEIRFKPGFPVRSNTSA